MANQFNQFFTNVAASIVKDIVSSESPPIVNNPDIPIFSFSNDPVTPSEVADVVQ